MRSRFITTLAVLSLLLIAALAGSVQAAPKTYTAPLDASQEVAAEPVESLARGLAVFQLSHDGTELSYRLNVANIENVNQAHIHLAPAGANGPVVVWLYPPAPPAQRIPGRFDGVLATGTITDANLVGMLAGQTVADLIDHIEAGNAYVNVHTNPGYPAGEIRGQL